RNFDVFNDTLSEQEVRIECTITQGEAIVHEQVFVFLQEPAESRTIGLTWTPAPVKREGVAVLSAVLLHGGQRMHELRVEYRLVSASLLRDPVEVERPAAYWGSDVDYGILRRLVPGCERVEREAIA
ncbi:hypothetical protein, partial [Peribacillus simplex]